MDSMLTHEIWSAVSKLADKHKSWDTYRDTQSYIPNILTMMDRGVKIDDAERAKLVADYRKRIRRLNLYLQIFAKRVWGKGLNPRSPVQLQQFFFEALGLPVKYQHKKGNSNVSTGRDALESLANEYVRALPFCRIIMRLRDHEKLVQTLSVGLHNGRWRCSYNAAGTDTGRWSSSAHPEGDGANAQNIKDKVRKIFVADDGHVIWNFDQQGAEARLVAYLCGDEKYIAAVETGDVHTMVAAMCFGFEPKRELAERKYYRDWSYRDISKRATHGTSYLGSAPTIARVTRLEVKVIEEFQAMLRRNFPGIFEWQRWVAHQIQTTGILTTPLGFKRQFFGRKHDDATIRAAIAFVPQSTVGRHTANGIRRLFALGDHHIEPLINGHDAVIGQSPAFAFAEKMPLIRKTLMVPMDVTDIHGKVRTLMIPWDGATGANWSKHHKDRNPNGLKEWSWK
jgi:DNA polymerase-1